MIIQWQKSINGTLMSANRLFVANGYSLKTKFKQSMVQRFGAETQNVKFGPDSTRTQINEWVESMTGHKIKDLIPPGILKNYNFSKYE